MKKLLIILFVLIGCTKFEIVNEIYPEVTIIGKEVGVVYKLGNLTVSDTWYKLGSEKIEYLKNPDNPKKYTLHVIFDEENHTDPYFFYYINGINFAKTNPVSEEVLLANMEHIDNFFLHKLDGNEVTEKNEEIIEKKIEEIKKEVKVADLSEKKNYKVEYDDGESKWD